MENDQIQLELEPQEDEILVHLFSLTLYSNPLPAFFVLP